MKKSEDAINSFLAKNTDEKLDHALAAIDKNTEKIYRERQKMQVLMDMAKGLPTMTALANANAAPRDDIDASGDAQKHKARLDAVKSYASAVKQELSQTSQIMGGLFRWDYEETFARMQGELTQGTEAWDAMAEAIQRVKDEMHFDQGPLKGFTDGLRRFAAEGADSFKNFSQAAQAAGSAVESAMSSAMQTAVESGKTGSQKWREIGEGLKNSGIKILTDLIAKQVIAIAVNHKAAAAEAAQTAAEKANTTAKAGNAAATGAAATAKAGAATASGTLTAALVAETAAFAANATAAAFSASAVTAENIANIYADAIAQAGILGVATGTGAVTAMMAATTAALAEYKAALATLTAFGRGGLVDRPTLALLGETGKKEFVAPEVDFFDWSGRLAENIMRRQDEANAYRAYTAAIIQSADLGGMKEPVVNNYYSVSDKRELASMIHGLVRYHEKRG